LVLALGCRRARTVSIALAYILLVVSAFPADALLMAVLAAFLSRGVPFVLRIVEQFFPYHAHPDYLC